MAAKKAGKKAPKSKDFDMDALLDYLRKVTGKDEASGYANLGSKTNSQLTKTLPVAAERTARGIDNFQTGGLVGLGYDFAAGKPITKKRVGGTSAAAALTVLPYGKLAKLGGKTYKNVKSATETAKQMRLLYNLLYE